MKFQVELVSRIFPSFRPWFVCKRRRPRAHGRRTSLPPPSSPSPPPFPPAKNHQVPRERMVERPIFRARMVTRMQIALTRLGARYWHWMSPVSRLAGQSRWQMQRCNRTRLKVIQIYECDNVPFRLRDVVCKSN